MDSLHQMRQEYAAGSLNETNMPQNPMEEFNVWLDFAINRFHSVPQQQRK